MIRYLCQAILPGAQNVGGLLVIQPAKETMIEILEAHVTTTKASGTDQLDVEIRRIQAWGSPVDGNAAVISSKLMDEPDPASSRAALQATLKGGLQLAGGTDVTTYRASSGMYRRPVHEARGWHAEPYLEGTRIYCVGDGGTPQVRGLAIHLNTALSVSHDLYVDLLVAEYGKAA